MTDSGYLFSIVAVNMSLASLAGLVIAFRRTGRWGGHDVFRLRQMVEQGFADALLALLTFPAIALIGSEAVALRLMSVVALAYVVANFITLQARRRGIPTLIPLTPLVVLIDVLVLAIGVTSIVVASLTSWALFLLTLTARPMAAFVMVLSTLGREDAS